jgi:hypothetical protein
MSAAFSKLVLARLFTTAKKNVRHVTGKCTNKDAAGRHSEEDRESLQRSKCLRMLLLAK